MCEIARDTVPAGRLRPGMMCAINLLEPLFHHVRVNLRGSNIGMTEHHLHRAQISAAIQKVRCKTMTEHVRLQWLPQSRFPAEFRNCFPKSVARTCSPVAIQEQKFRRAIAEKLRSRFPKIKLNDFHGLAADGNQPLLASLPHA